MCTRMYWSANALACAPVVISWPAYWSSASCCAAVSNESFSGIVMSCIASWSCTWSPM